MNSSSAANWEERTSSVKQMISGWLLFGGGGGGGVLQHWHWEKGCFFSASIESGRRWCTTRTQKHTAFPLTFFLSGDRPTDRQTGQADIVDEANEARDWEWESEKLATAPVNRLRMFVQNTAVQNVDADQLLELTKKTEQWSNWRCWVGSIG